MNLQLHFGQDFMKRKTQNKTFSSSTPKTQCCCLNVQAHYKGFSMSVKNNHNFHHTNLNGNCTVEKFFFCTTNKIASPQTTIH
jgi:hypothetical protein